MTAAPDIICIGSALWDVIGRTPLQLPPGSDVPGRIVRMPGGVALNIALALARFGLRPALLSAVGLDSDGASLVDHVERRGCITDFLYRSADLPTDRYMAIEGADGLLAAVADAHSLEMAGERILLPLQDGRLASAERPWPGPVALDGNLTTDLLDHLAHGPLLRMADLRVAPASPGKADRLLVLLGQPRATFYVNRAEAERLCQRPFRNAAEAAEGLLARGVRRALVTDGGAGAADADAEGCLHKPAPSVAIARVTGAGDTFMAAHIAAECQGCHREDALSLALAAAARHVSGDTAS
ncbi:PfkB family carbohydrate kinase [Rubellimicrobium sp. CFH 75288]|uniref:PfkB family carbohydrate kinase n=1 Tax=Rubellimicrobium sp. CFH 75288 TaxID=2697034 RepID=UPI001412F38F|nr:PfkB family carbohydrate kinase [Rubellimicrobium sp. CFH 75288]NAZ36922.1 kinase [Rubellimicrobium sp. CFH 75288]